MELNLIFHLRNTGRADLKGCGRPVALRPPKRFLAFSRVCLGAENCIADPECENIFCAVTNQCPLDSVLTLGLQPSQKGEISRLPRVDAESRR